MDACATADIVVTATNSSSPVVQGAWIRPGTHINAVGSYTPTAAELDGDVIARSAGTDPQPTYSILNARSVSGHTRG